MTSPNARRPIASARRLAEQIGVHTTTVMNMMHGAADTDPAIVAAAADALRVDVRKVSQQVGQMRTEQAPWDPPAEVNLLSRRQQLALSELIRSMAEEREGRGNQPATTKPAVSATAVYEIDAVLAGPREQLRRDLEAAVTRSGHTPKTRPLEVRDVINRYIQEADDALASLFARDAAQSDADAG
jgi:hypothetical protein